MHVFDLPGSQIDEASNMILETFKWRKKFGVDGISADTTNQSFFEKGTVYSHNRDKDGKKLLVFVVGRHTKGSEKMEDMKKFFVYYLERLEREELEDEITIVFDCRNAGLKNMDMEFMQFIIGMLKDYYPWMVNYILVFEMPWVLNAAWKVIKAWLPAAAVKKIKFLTKSNMGEYITDDNRLEIPNYLHMMMAGRRQSHLLTLSATSDRVPAWTASPATPPPPQQTQTFSN